MTTTTNTVTKLDVLRAVRRLAEEQPDYVYVKQEDTYDGTGGCRYREDDDTPGCIVGQALARVLPEFRATEGVRASLVLHNATDTEATYAEQNWIDTVQNRQDKGLSWGVALAEADHAWGRIGATDE